MIVKAVYNLKKDKENATMECVYGNIATYTVRFGSLGMFTKETYKNDYEYFEPDYKIYLDDRAKATDEDGYNVELLCVYLMNDQGQTIERIK